MQIKDINADTERAFFSCLHLEEPEDLEITAHSRHWYAEHKDKGYRAQVLILDDGRIVGKCHFIPIEHSPFVGKELLAILCLCVLYRTRFPGHNLILFMQPPDGMTPAPRSGSDSRGVPRAIPRCTA